jgi:hypothetical protein
MLPFLKYVQGAAPGKAPKKKIETSSEAEIKKKAKHYDEVQRTRCFQPGWKVGCDWIDFDNTNMKCSTCKKYWNDKRDRIKDSYIVWIEGTQNFKLDTIKKHELSKMHLEAQKAKTNMANIKKSEAGQALRSLNMVQTLALNIRFRNAHALAKHGLSFKNYTWMCQLDKAKGLEIGHTYDNDKAARNFLHHIAKVETQKTSDCLQEAFHFSFTIDGATDISGEEQESVYVHWCFKGVRRSRFVAFVTPTTTTSADIYAAVAEAINTLSVNGEGNSVLKKVVGLTTDGASNMTGHVKGVAALLKADYPEVTTIHCLAHRVELAVKDHIKKANNKLYDRAMTLLIGLFYFYKKSFKQTKQLMRAFEGLQISPRLPMRVGGTRWVPHTIAAIDAFCHSYLAICSQLDTSSHNNPKANGLSNLAHDKGVVTYILILKVRTSIYNIKNVTKYCNYFRIFI